MTPEQVFEHREQMRVRLERAKQTAEERMQLFKLATGYPDPWEEFSVQNLTVQDRSEIVDAWISFCMSTMRALVLVRPHRWHNEWPGNVCEACGLDDPFEEALVCPNCELELSDYDENSQPIFRLCGYHRVISRLPCDGYSESRRTGFGAPSARQRFAYPGRWFLVSSDGLCEDGSRWWEGFYRFGIHWPKHIPSPVFQRTEDYR